MSNGMGSFINGSWVGMGAAPSGGAPSTVRRGGGGGGGKNKKSKLNPVDRGVPEGAGFPNGLPMNNANPVPQWQPPGMGHDFNIDARRLAQHQMPPSDYMQQFLPMMSERHQGWLGNQIAQQQPQMPTPAAPLRGMSDGGKFWFGDIYPKGEGYSMGTGPWGQQGSYQSQIPDILKRFPGLLG